MDALEYQRRIHALQQLRHHLLSCRENDKMHQRSIDMQLNVVRSELHALYTQMRKQKSVNQRASATQHHLQKV